MKDKAIHLKIVTLIEQSIPKARGHLHQSQSWGKLRPCAVLVPLIQGELEGEEISLLMIKRSSHLRRNPGEYAFPGGIFEVEDRGNPFNCAIREWHEEIGPSPPDYILGCLDDFYTSSGLVITPVVGWFETRPIVEFSVQEIEAVFYVPLSSFAVNNLKREIITQSDRQFETNVYDLENRRIWGATASIISNLVEILLNGD